MPMIRAIQAGFGLAAAAGVALLVGGWPGPAPAQPDTRRPLLIEAVKDLDFGKLTTDRALGGVIVLDPGTGQKRSRGAAVDLSGYHSPAVFHVSGEPRARFVITLPRRVELSDKGDDRAVLEDFRAEPERIGILNANGEATIRVGATLRLPEGSSAGRFRGDFTVFVDYEH